MLVLGVVVETVVGLPAVLQLQLGREGSKGRPVKVLMGVHSKVAGLPLSLSAAPHHPKPAGRVLRDGQLREDVVQEPLEALAAQLLSQASPLAHVSKGFLRKQKANNINDIFKTSTLMFLFYFFFYKTSSSARHGSDQISSRSLLRSEVKGFFFFKFQRVIFGDF